MHPRACVPTQFEKPTPPARQAACQVQNFQVLPAAPQTPAASPEKLASLLLAPVMLASLLLAAHSSAACQAQTADAQVGCILWSGGSALLSCLASCRWVHRQPPATEPPVCRLQGRLFSKLELKFCSHLVVSADLRYRAWPRGAGCLCPKSVGEPKSVIVSLLCAQASVVETRWIVQQPHGKALSSVCPLKLHL